MSVHQFRLDRRGLLFGASALLVSGPVLAQGAAPIAATKAGRVRGKVVDGINVFRGVRYGASTAGRRFMPPTPPQPWTDVQEATDFGNQSPQLGAERPSVYASWSNPRAASEDCLFLNVYTPGLRDGKKRPVMVWFHGGGFTSGSASSHYADGTRLARRGDVVVVTVNHRLNAFGYLYLAHLDPALADSGNVGSLDMIQALKWVRDNAAEFGGDGGNVTIFGQSGGGGKVSQLVAMPGAAGLIHRAIVQSGSGIRSRQRDQAEADTAKVLKAVGGDVNKLRTMPFQALSDAILDAGAGYGPVVDGRSMPRHPFDPDAPPTARNVPMLIGTAQTETTSLVGGRDDSLFGLSWDTLPARLSRDLQGVDTNMLIADLRRIEPDAKPSDIYFVATTEARFRPRAILQAERKAAQAAAGGKPAYMYLFAWETPVDGGKWRSPHSIEHAFVFDNVAKSASMVGSGADQQKVADTVSSTWIRFARTGDPGWAPYTPQRRATMVFNVESRVVDDPRRAERLLFGGKSLS
jgi:para-nitrobenzyl esterase